MAPFLHNLFLCLFMSDMNMVFLWPCCLSDHIRTRMWEEVFHHEHYEHEKTQKANLRDCVLFDIFSTCCSVSLQ